MKFTVLGHVVSKKNNKKAYNLYLPKAIERMKVADKVSGPVKINIEFCLKGWCRGNKTWDSDIDNLTSSVMDTLVEAQVIDDDRSVIQLSLIKTYGHNEFSTIFDITPFSFRDRLNSYVKSVVSIFEKKEDDY